MFSLSFFHYLYRYNFKASRTVWEKQIPTFTASFSKGYMLISFLQAFPYGKYENIRSLSFPSAQYHKTFKISSSLALFFLFLFFFSEWENNLILILVVFHHSLKLCQSVVMEIISMPNGGLSCLDYDPWKQQG